MPSQESPFRILILGDGNFSFSLALCRLLWPDSADYNISHKNANVAYAYLGLPLLAPHAKIEITATSFDDRQELLKKYPETKDILASLQSSKFIAQGVEVLHGINAWELQKHFGVEKKFNVVVWNHPHLGTEDFRLHRFLMAHFFNSVASVLHPETSCVCVSLVEGQEERWDLVKEAARSNLGLRQVALFDETLWPGYVVKRNKHGGSFKNMHTKKHTRSQMKSHLFRFVFGPAYVQWKGLAETQIDYCLTAPDRPDIDRCNSNMHSNSEELSSSSADSGKEQQGEGCHLVTDIALPISTPCSPAPVKPMISSRKSRRLAAIPADLKCPQCSKQLTSARGYLQHVHMTHTLQKFGSDWTPTRDRTLQCRHDGCQKTFAHEQDLWQHTVNIHSTVTSSELPAVDQLGNEDGNAAPGSDYDYVPCDVCGQAVVKREWGMSLHLETLKPAVGLDMRCPLCQANGEIHMGFIESRALFQHYKFCRLKRLGSTS